MDGRMIYFHELSFINFFILSFFYLLFLCFDHRIPTFSADLLANYVEFTQGGNSKKQEVDVNVLEVDVKECVDHLMVVEDVDPPPEPNDDEATMIRRVTRKREK